MAYSNEEYLVELLQEAGLIDERAVQTARGTKKPNESLIDTLIKTGVISDEQVAQNVAVNSGMEYVDLMGFTPVPEAKDLVPLDVAMRYKIAALGTDRGRLQVVVSDPYDFETLDALPHVLQPDIEFFCSTPAAIKTLMSNIYGNEAVMGGANLKAVGGGPAGNDDAPIIRLVNNMMMEAFKSRTSDIHIEPLEKDVRVRYRIDGVLQDMEHHPKRIHAAIISRIKIMTNTMSMDEKRVPQDGRIQMSFNDKELDLRVSIIPTNNGESRGHAYS